MVVKDDGAAYRRCDKCGELFAADGQAFQRHKDCRRGITHTCRECFNSDARAAYDRKKQTNPNYRDGINANRRARRANPENRARENARRRVNRRLAKERAA